MRLSQEEILLLKNSILQIDPRAKIYLFGSRISDEKKGGDIDILILTSEKLSFDHISSVRWHFFEKFGEQKIDLLNFTFDENSAFKSMILQEAKQL